MQEMGGRMIKNGGLPCCRVDPSLHCLAKLQAAAAKPAQMSVRLAVLHGVVDFEDQIIRLQQANITDLTTGFGIKRRLIKDYHALLARAQHIDAAAFTIKADHLTFANQRRVTGKFGSPTHFTSGEVVTLEPTSAARPDRKSTRLNSSHVAISYAVFCLKKKNNKIHQKNIYNT